MRRDNAAEQQCARISVDLGVNNVAALPSVAFAKQDSTDDALFHVPVRLVTHIDDAAIAVLGAFYRRALPRHGVTLDLMSSWVSHLPAELPVRELIGHGMNARELAANPQLDRWFVQNLNASPILPFRDASLDACLCCVSVQYLQCPVEVFAEVHRLLRAGARLAVGFSNHYFPTKAVRIWPALDAGGQAAIVQAYMQHAGFASSVVDVLRDGRDGDPLIAVAGLA